MILPAPTYRREDRLVGPVVYASVSRAADPGFDSRFHREDISESSHTSDLKIGTPVATLPGAWSYRFTGLVGRVSVYCNRVR